MVCGPPRLVFQTLQAFFFKAFRPDRHSIDAGPDCLGNFDLLTPLRAKQNDPSAQAVALSGGGRSNAVAELGLFLWGNVKNGNRTCHVQGWHSSIIIAS
jgi:hypothetical protein